MDDYQKRWGCDEIVTNVKKLSTKLYTLNKNSGIYYIDSGIYYSGNSHCVDININTNIM